MTDHTTGRNLFVRTGTGPRDAGVRRANWLRRIHFQQGYQAAIGADIAPWIARRLLDYFGLRPSGKQRCVIEDLANPLVLTDPERQLLLQLSNGYRLGELARVEGVRPRELTGRVREIYRKMQWQLRAGGLALQGG